MTDQELKDLVAGNAIAISKLERTMNGIWFTQWAISEELIAENFKKALRKEWEEITTIQRNVEIFKKWKDNAETEIDIIWINWTKVFIWETKTKLSKKHINKLINNTIPKFKKYLHKQRYGWLDIYGVVWTRVFADKEVKEYAKEKGLYIIKEQHNWNARILKESLKTVKSL